MKGLILGTFVCLLNVACNSRPSDRTAAVYRNEVVVSKTEYSKDSVEIQSVLKIMLNRHLRPFRPESQFDANTAVFVDSIIYSPNKLRMIVFVITKNNTNKLLKKENDAPFFFNANYLYCSRNALNSAIKIYEYTGVNFAYYYDLNQIKQRLRDYCFIDLGNEKNKYNIDDIRFWTAEDFNWVLENSEATKAQ